LDLPLPPLSLPLLLELDSDLAGVELFSVFASLLLPLDFDSEDLDSLPDELLESLDFLSAAAPCL
jgi:hypothetical protein